VKISRCKRSQANEFRTILTRKFYSLLISFNNFNVHLKWSGINYLLSGQVVFVLFASHWSAIDLLFDDGCVVTWMDARRGNRRRGRRRRHQTQPSPSSSGVIVVIRRKIWRIFLGSFLATRANGQRR
jgi:hypothetical protein